MSGCDSVVTLTLTITPSEDATFIWISSYCTADSNPNTISGTQAGIYINALRINYDASSGYIDLLTLIQGLTQFSIYHLIIHVQILLHLILQLQLIQL